MTYVMKKVSINIENNYIVIGTYDRLSSFHCVLCTLYFDHIYQYTFFWGNKLHQSFDDLLILEYFCKGFSSTQTCQIDQGLPL